MLPRRFAAQYAPGLKEALQLANWLGNTMFKADGFKKRQNIKQLVVSGESSDVSDVTVEAWLERLPSILNGYSQDIWNQDKTGFFYRALPEKSLVEKKRQCHGGKKAKQIQQNNVQGRKECFAAH